eukprot:TRINITY_DN6830_c0_g1_i13.p4 TRINITY_DN6830_c0_g1~~TRINITY_DN6830_c0_g1_i13.p4  ORF type:complete len:149 (+),score=2.91 TRINITY_DN6830_c0_g1_i13:284-730(+)
MSISHFVFGGAVYIYFFWTFSVRVLDYIQLNFGMDNVCVYTHTLFLIRSIMGGLKIFFFLNVNILFIQSEHQRKTDRKCRKTDRKCSCAGFLDYSNNNSNSNNNSIFPSTIFPKQGFIQRKTSFQQKLEKNINNFEGNHVIDLSFCQQ